MLNIVLFLQAAFTRMCFEQRWPLGFGSLSKSDSWQEYNNGFVYVKDYKFSSDG